MPFRFNPFTDRLDLTDVSNSPSGNLSFLTGNTGGPVPGDASQNINVIGASGIIVTGTPVNNTLTITPDGAVIGQTITGQSGGPLSPIAGNWNIFGGSVVAGTAPVVTSGAGNTLTVNVQRSQAIASTNSTNVGLSAFNSAQFTVDANGFVSLLGGGQAIDSVQVDASTAPGTNPVLPSVAGLIIVTGGQIAAATTANVIQTNSLAVNTYTVQIQRSQAVASSTIGSNGVSHFNSSQFTVDANGFVSSNGSGFIWIDQATGIVLAINRGYFVTAATTQTLPAAPSQGDVVKIICDTTGAVVITANAGQTIRLGNTASAGANTFTSTARGDSLELIYRAATTQWIALDSVGNWTIST